MNEGNSSPSWLRVLAIPAAKIAVSAGLLWVLFSRIDAGRVWAGARSASVWWLLASLVVYAATVLASVWRWHQLLVAQRVPITRGRLLESFLVSLFFNNFLPSNIGGDVIRIRDSARSAGSTTLATTVVIVDRVIGLMALVFVAATGATVAATGAHHASPTTWAWWLWSGFVLCGMVAAPAVMLPDGVARLLRPLTVFHPEWIGERIVRLTAVLARFREHPGILLQCFAWAVFVQAAFVLFYLAVADGLRVGIAFSDLAVLIPVSFVIQMLPVSVNGFGVREATFSLYFTRIGLPIESAVLLSLVSTALVMLFSLIGAVAWFARRQE